MNKITSLLINTGYLIGIGMFTYAVILLIIDAVKNKARKASIISILIILILIGITLSEMI